MTPTILGIDHLEFVVGDAALTARFFCSEFGFSPLAVSADGSATSVLVAQGRIHLVFTSPLTATGPESERLQRHGSGIRDIAFRVADAAAAYELLVGRGAVPLVPPRSSGEGAGEIVQATVRSFHPTLVHSLVERRSDGAELWPGRSRPAPGWHAAPALALESIDHVAICADWQELDRVVDFYRRVFGLEPSREEDVRTELSGMRSRVVESSDGAVRLVCMEPLAGRQESQIAEYLRHHGGPGVQHVGFHVRDILAASRLLHGRGIPFLEIPPAYYAELPDRVGPLPFDLESLRCSNVLVDREGDALLLQAFTRPIYTRPTFFCELIERRGARGFGSGNIAALFRAVENEQRRRAPTSLAP